MNECKNRARRIHVFQTVHKTDKGAVTGLVKDKQKVTHDLCLTKIHFLFTSCESGTWGFELHHVSQKWQSILLPHMKMYSLLDFCVSSNDEQMQELKLW